MLAKDQQRIYCNSPAEHTASLFPSKLLVLTREEEEPAVTNTTRVGDHLKWKEKRGSKEELQYLQRF